VLLAGAPVIADDTELFVNDAASLPTGRPNILFIIDNSGSMDATLVTHETYDPAEVYPGSCSPDRVYWRSGTGDPPECGTDSWFSRAVLVCNAAVQAFANGGGRYTNLMAQYRPANERWQRISAAHKSDPVECEDDSGLHGDGSSATEVYAQDGNSAQRWSALAGAEVSWGSVPTDRTYTIYDANFLNWYYGPSGVSTRMQVVKDVVNGLLATMNGVNVGLMQFNTEEGGPVVHAMEDMGSARSAMQAKINALKATTFTPLSETLYEAALYYRGGLVDYGHPDGGSLYGPVASAQESRRPDNPAAYLSPVEMSCQKNFIVLLTDGEPTLDVSANDKIPALPGFASLVGPSCDPAGLDGNGDCLDDLAEYLYRSDARPDLPGTQNVTTHVIGFAIDLPILAATAARGGGLYFTADDTASLSNALANIVTSMLDFNTTFTAPTVSVNAFNRTQHLNELFVTMFRPTGDAHWPGNIKKYRLRPSDGVIVDADGNPAVDPTTGFFAQNSRSYWSATVDGPNVEAGGAAHRLPHPDLRTVFTFLGNFDLTASSNEVSRLNPALGDTLLNSGGSGEPTREDVIDFIRGREVGGDGSGVPRNEMGDPLHAQPATVVYGPDAEDIVVFFATNHGVLHAINAETGVEKWAFMLPDFLDMQRDLMVNDVTPNKLYGIDGNLRVQILSNQDGVISGDDGDRVLLYFGMRRGGDFYYALDVTDPDRPELLWRLGEGDLPGIGQSWSTPVPTRINVQGVNQNDDHLVLVFGGGYDASQDNLEPSSDGTGNSIYIVDSISGALLWHGTSGGTDANFARMNRSIPAEVRVIDFNGNGYADRMYAADMGGQIWRFDVFNGQPRSSLVTGGVIAELGTAPSATGAIEHNRRFYYPPDVALATSREFNFLHVGVGSGHRARPNGTHNQDRFYALRDYAMFGKLTQADYDTLTPVRDADLVDVTEAVNAIVPQGSPGWKLELRDGGWRGEKVLAGSSTFNNRVFFTTFRPGTNGTEPTCEPVPGTNRLYSVSLFNGAPLTNLDGSIDDTELTVEDRYMEFTGSIPSEVVFIFPSPEVGPGDAESCVGDECQPPVFACVDLFCFPPGFENNPIRTYWSQENLD
jgi:type IV pilus assembly protein PilY1